MEAAIHFTTAPHTLRGHEAAPCTSSAAGCQSAAAFRPPQIFTGTAGQPGRGRQWTMVAHAIKSLTDAENEDLLQYKDRDRWYLPTFAADDAPDWNTGRFVRSRQLAPGVKEVVLEAEVSREQVPLRNAYRHVGQKASVRINSGVECTVPVCASPFPQHLIKDALFRLRGDMTSGEIKKVKVLDSVKAELPLLVMEGNAPDLYKMAEDDIVEIGPFAGAGMDLRGPLVAMYQFPTIVIFCEGAGIATAKALLETQPPEGGLNFPYREDVRMYYRAPNQEALCYKDRFDEWEQKFCCKVITSTRDTFQDMFDDDNTLAYEPESTAAIILTGGDEEAEAAAIEISNPKHGKLGGGMSVLLGGMHQTHVCKEAEIEEVATDSREQMRSVYIVKGSEGPTISDRKKAEATAA